MPCVRLGCKVPRPPPWNLAPSPSWVACSRGSRLRCATCVARPEAPPPPREDLGQGLLPVARQRLEQVAMQQQQVTDVLVTPSS